MQIMCIGTVSSPPTPTPPWVLGTDLPRMYYAEDALDISGKLRSLINKLKKKKIKQCYTQAAGNFDI